MELDKLSKPLPLKEIIIVIFDNCFLLICLDTSFDNVFVMHFAFFFIPAIK